jgi:hypothetical protein
MATETRRSVTLMLKNKRLGFTDLAEPRSVNGDKPSYGCRIILDPNDPDVAVIEAAIKEVATTQWKDKANDVLEMLTEKGRVAFLKKPYRNTKGEVHKGFEGKYSLGASASEDKQPGCFDNVPDEKGKPRELDAAGIRRKLYSGCYANVKVDIYPLLREDGNRIACGLLGVMFADHGEAFGGGSAPATADDFAGMALPMVDAEDLV